MNVIGTLDDSAPAGGRGGFVETSAAKVKIADGAQVKSGHWLIDPDDFTIAASGGDITGTALSTALGAGNVTIQTTSGTASCTGATCGSGTSGNGDIFVRDNVTWTSGNTLTLSAHRNIDIVATLDASGGAGFAPIENDTNKFAGRFDGPGHTISGVTISLPLGASGLRGTIGYAHTHYELGKNFKNLGASGTAKVTTLGLAYPLIRSQKSNLALLATWQHEWLNDKQQLANANNDKESDVLPIALTFDLRDGFAGGGLTYGSLAYTAGQRKLDVSVDSEACSLHPPSLPKAGLRALEAVVDSPSRSSLYCNEAESGK